MIGRWMTAIGLVALLAGCAVPRQEEQQAMAPWNGGTWNSVLGYVGPYNMMRESPGR